MNSTAEPPVERKFGTIDVWCEVSGMSRRVTYERLATSDLRAKKLGNRTLIDFEHGLAYLRSLPAAEFASPRRKAQLLRQAERRNTAAE